MNIIEQTLTQLKFEGHNQQWLWGVLFSVPFLTVGFSIAIMTSNVTTLECQRTNPTQINCKRTIAGLPGTETTWIPGQIKRAYVKTVAATGVVLNISNNQEVNLVNHGVLVREKHSQIADEINVFIQNSQQTELRIQEDDRWQGFLEGLVLFLPGIGIILQSLAIPIQVLCDFDKISEQMRLEKQYQFFGTFTTKKKLAEIQQVQVILVENTNKSPWYFVQLQLISAKPISLSAPTRDRQQCQIMVDAIDKFLHLKKRA